MPANEENKMTQPVIFIDQERLIESLSEVGNDETFYDSIVALIDAGFDVAVGPQSAPNKVFANSDDFVSFRYVSHSCRHWRD